MTKLSGTSKASSVDSIDRELDSDVLRAWGRVTADTEVLLDSGDTFKFYDEDQFVSDVEAEEVLLARACSLSADREWMFMLPIAGNLAMADYLWFAAFALRGRNFFIRPEDEFLLPYMHKLFPISREIFELMVSNRTRGEVTLLMENAVANKYCLGIVTELTITATELFRASRAVSLYAMAYNQLYPTTEFRRT